MIELILIFLGSLILPILQLNHNLKKNESNAPKIKKGPNGMTDFKFFNLKSRTNIPNTPPKTKPK